MVTVDLIGGLGNNLFQIATGLSIAKYLNTDFKVDGIPKRGIFGDFNGHSFEFLKIFEDIGFIDKEITNINKSYHHVDLSDSWGYIQPVMSDNTIYHGYFQSPKYFSNIDLNQYFIVRNDLIESIKNKYQMDDVNTSIHFQYGKDRENLQDKHPYISNDYYIKAINSIKNKGKLYVVSNNIELVKERMSNYFGDDVVYVDDEMKNCFVLMYLCNNNIIGNSTFSWWASFLNQNKDKTVIAPKSEWFGSYSHLKTDDMFPEEWLCF